MAMEWVESGKNYRRFSGGSFTDLPFQLITFPGSDRIDKTGNRNSAAVAFVVTVVVEQAESTVEPEKPLGITTLHPRACRRYRASQTKATTWQADYPT